MNSEVELCRPIVSWLNSQHWEVYQEVQTSYGGKRADIVAVRGPAIWVIEAKLSLSLSVIEQALHWKYYATYISVAVPVRKRRSPGKDLLYQLGLGIVEVQPYKRYGDFGITNRFGTFNKPRKMLRERMKAALSPMHKTGEFGEAGNAAGERWTPYRNTMHRVQRILKENGPCTMGQIMEVMGREQHHYTSDQSAKQSMRKALDLWEDWCVVDKSGKEYLYHVKAV